MGQNGNELLGSLFVVTGHLGLDAVQKTGRPKWKKILRLSFVDLHPIARRAPPSWSKEGVAA
jgi:hypothetical protein